MMNIQTSARQVLLAPAMVLALAGCADKTLAIGNLYQRLGGEASVARIVDDFIVNVQEDARIKEQFVRTDLPRFKTALAAQICELGGGPCTYTGPSMRTAHQGMKITNVEFDAFIGDLAKALDRHGVDPGDQRELLFKLEAMRIDVMALDAGG